MFDPAEVKATCREIDAFLQADNGLCIDIVRKGALSLARDRDKVLHSIRVDRMKPDELALTLVYNVLFRNLQSGSFHIYRGLLSVQGEDMLRLWRATAKELVKRGYSSDDDYKTESAGVVEGIQAAG